MRPRVTFLAHAQESDVNGLANDLIDSGGGSNHLPHMLESHRDRSQRFEGGKRGKHEQCNQGAGLWITAYAICR